MKSRGFTLIELMIVCAILGIAFSFFLPAVRQLIVQQKRVDLTVNELRALNKAFLLIKSEIAQATKIIDLDMKRIIFDNDRTLIFENDGRTLLTMNKKLELPGKIRINDLRPVNPLSFSTQVNTGVDSVRVYWRIGE